jgi:hypothetical protein
MGKKGAKGGRPPRACATANGFQAPVKLPKATLRRCKPLFETFRGRRTTRDISDKALSLQTLANLLWAAFGVNRQKGPFGLKGRTAASASNSQEIDVYVALSTATYRYDAFAHALLPIISGDLRPSAISRGQSSLPYGAAARLIYVANVARLTHTEGFAEPGLKDPAVQKSYYYVDTGLIAANVYLFAASTGLAAWFHNCDRATLTKKLGLRRNQRALFAQTVGHRQRKGRTV